MQANETKIIDEIEGQARHILRMHEDTELEDKIIELARNWFYKGLKQGLIHAMEQQKEKESDLNA